MLKPCSSPVLPSLQLCGPHMDTGSPHALGVSAKCNAHWHLQGSGVHLKTGLPHATAAPARDRSTMTVPVEAWAHMGTGMGHALTAPAHDRSVLTVPCLLQVTKLCLQACGPTWRTAAQWWPRSRPRARRGGPCGMGCCAPSLRSMMGTTGLTRPPTAAPGAAPWGVPLLCAAQQRHKEMQLI